MNKDIGNKLNENSNSSSYDDDITSSKITEILSQYEKGIESIFESPKKEDEENYFILLLTCPDSFHTKFASLNQSQSNSHLYSMALKYYNAFEKKKLKNQEIRNENQMSRLNSISIKEIVKQN